MSITPILLTVPKWEWSSCSRGSEAHFLPQMMRAAGVWYGVKVYRTQAEAHRAYHRNRRAYEKGLGPPYGPIVALDVRQGKRRKPVRMHGYFQAHVEVNADYDHEGGGGGYGNAGTSTSSRGSCEDWRCRDSRTWRTTSARGTPEPSTAVSS